MDRPSEIQIYLGQLNFKADLDLFDATGANEPTAGLKNFHTVKRGSIVAF